MQRSRPHSGNPAEPTITHQSPGVGTDDKDLAGQLAALQLVREQQLRDLSTTDDNIASISKKIELLGRSSREPPRSCVVDYTDRVLYPLTILYQLSMGNWAIAAFTVTSFAVSLKMHTLNRQLKQLRVIAFIVTPSFAVFGVLGVMQMPTFIPTAVLLPSLGVLLHESVWQQLVLVLFLNALIFCFAETNLACAVSAVATPLTIATMLVNDHYCSQVSHWRDFWSAWSQNNVIGVAVAVPLAVLILLLRLHDMYPDAIWQFVLEFEDGTTLCHGVGIMCLIGSYHCSSIRQQNMSGHVEHLQNMFFKRWKLGGLWLFICALCGLYMISINNWLGLLMSLVLSALHVRAPPSQQTMTTHLYIVTFIVGPLLGVLAELGVLSKGTGIPAAVFVPSLGVLLHKSVWQQLVLVLFLNALIFCFAQTNLACAVSALATPLSCIAVYIKMTKLIAASQALETAASKQQAHREEAKRRQAELAAATETAKADLYCQIVSATAHDIKTPMSAIKSGCSAMRMQNEPATVIKVLDCMEETLIVAFDFIDTMVLSAKYMGNQGNQMPVGKQETVFLKQMASRVISCTSHAVSPATTVHFAISDSVPASVVIDQSFVTRSVLNFLSNAARHTTEGTICLSIDLSPCASFLVFSVSDTGTGVASCVLDRIWDPFVSFSSSSGLGLFIVKAQCTTAGGECGHRDGADGAGAVFWFSAPFLSSAVHDSSNKQCTEPARLRAVLEKGETRKHSFEDGCAQSGALVETGHIVSRSCHHRNTEVQHQSAEEALASAKSGQASIVAVSGAASETNTAAGPLNAYERSVFDTGHLVAMNKLLAQTQEEMLATVGPQRRQLKKKQRLMDQLIGARHATLINPRTSPQSRHNQNEITDVLLIDDSPMVLQLCALELRLHNIKVDALGPVEGLEALKKNHYRLVLCDYFMGFATGPELTSEFRLWEAQHRPGCTAPIYVLTANMDECMAQKCDVAGLKILFSKPLDVQDIRQWLSKADGLNNHVS